VIAACSGCASTSDSTERTSARGVTAPNPNGCYIKVFDQPQMRGQADFINGPRRYVTLSQLPNGANWSKRIRSLQVGPGATATMWSDVNFEGMSWAMRVDTAYPTLPPGLEGSVQSMDVRCMNSAP
jgi:hypothetical protein